MVVWDEVQTLHIAQQMPLPLTISCSSKSRLVLPFWYLLTRAVPDISRRAVKRLCVWWAQVCNRGTIRTFYFTGIQMVRMAEVGAPISQDGVAVHLNCLCYLHFAPENPEDGKQRYDIWVSPSGKWVLSSVAGKKGKHGSFICGWTCGWQVKLYDPLLTSAISECFKHEYCTKYKELYKCPIYLLTHIYINRKAGGGTWTPMSVLE